MNNPDRRGGIVQTIKNIRKQVSRKAEIAAADRRGLMNASEFNQALGEAIRKSSPFLAGKIGGNEWLTCLWHLEWRRWVRLWRKVSWEILEPLESVAGIFPRTPESYHKFARQFIQSLSEVDYMGLRHSDAELKIVSQFSPEAKIGNFLGFEPYFKTQSPWTQALAGKKVLVATPFATTVSQQVPKLDKIWAAYAQKYGTNLIPDSTTFDVVRTPYCFDPNVQQQYGSWEIVLDRITSEIQTREFDLAIVGCGGLSIPLGANIKSMGASAIHLGGPTQILFGIQGSRWKTKSWFVENHNEHWISPLPEDRPEEQLMKRCENACYW
jgi:hypothetical protein